MWAHINKIIYIYIYDRNSTLSNLNIKASEAYFENINPILYPRALALENANTISKRNLTF